MKPMWYFAFAVVTFILMCVDATADQSVFTWKVDSAHQYYTLMERDLPVLRYNFGNVPLPAGVDLKHFADGRPYGGERSNYFHPVYGLNGEVISDDYPEHPHHRGIWLSWPVVRWNDRVADLWAVCDVWARPERVEAIETNPRMALLSVINLWKFGAGQQHSIVREAMTLRVYPTTGTDRRSRMFDIDVTLMALEHGVAIGGRPKGGYGGMTYRAAPGENQEIVPFIAKESADARGAWCRYSADFPGSRMRTSLVLFQHASNPGYPTAHHVYPNLNCFMPAFPGDTEYPLPKGKPVTLKHRFWILEGVPSHEELQQAWENYQSQNAER